MAFSAKLDMIDVASVTTSDVAVSIASLINSRLVVSGNAPSRQIAMALIPLTSWPIELECPLARYSRAIVSEGVDISSPCIM